LLREVRAQGVDALVLNLYFHVEDVPFSSEGPENQEAQPNRKAFQRFRIPANASAALRRLRRRHTRPASPSLVSSCD
jgi:hypothetical protein